MSYYTDSEITKLRREIQHNRKEIERLTTEVKDWQQRCVNANGEIERLQRDNKWLGELRDQLYSDKALLTALRKEDGEDMQRLSDQLDYLSDENAKLQAVVEAAELVRDYPEIREYIGTLLYYKLADALSALKEADDD